MKQSHQVAISPKETNMLAIYAKRRGLHKIPRSNAFKAPKPTFFIKNCFLII